VKKAGLCGMGCKCGPTCGCTVVCTCQGTAKINKPAPQFEADAWWNGMKKVKLTDYRGKYVVLFFYPLYFTFGCPTEIVQFSDKSKLFSDIDCQVIGASVDSTFSHMEYCKKDRKKGGLGKMEIPLLADITKKIASAYGCLADGENEGVAYRATYIIDKKGVLRHMTISDLPVGRSIDEVLRLVKAFQYADEFGEVCPAQWVPGQKTMVTDLDSAKTQEYWESEHGK